MYDDRHRKVKKTLNHYVALRIVFFKDIFCTRPTIKFDLLQSLNIRICMRVCMLYPIFAFSCQPIQR